MDEFDKILDPDDFEEYDDYDFDIDYTPCDEDELMENPEYWWEFGAYE